MEFLNDLRMLGVDDEIIKKAWKIWAGNSFYLPVFKEFSLVERNALIRKEFNGKNHRQLAVKYGINYSWICKIIRGVEVKKWS